MSRRCVALPLSDGTVARVHVDGMLSDELRAGLIELLDATVRAYSEPHPEPAAATAVVSS